MSTCHLYIHMCIHMQDTYHMYKNLWKLRFHMWTYLYTCIHKYTYTQITYPNVCTHTFMLYVYIYIQTVVLYGHRRCTHTYLFIHIQVTCLHVSICDLALKLHMHISMQITTYPHVHTFLCVSLLALPLLSLRSPVFTGCLSI